MSGSSALHLGADWRGMRDVILVDTFKGGVGKTTTAVALAHSLSRLGPTLLVGTSPQNDVLDSLVVVPSVRKGLREFLAGGSNPDHLELLPNLNLIPAGYANPGDDPVALAVRLRQLMAEQEERYVVIDGFNFTDATGVAALLASDGLITPTTIYPEATRAVLRVFRFVQDRIPLEDRPRVIRVLLTQVPSASRRNKAEQSLYQAVSDAWQPWLFTTQIRRSARYNITELPTVGGSAVVRGALAMAVGTLAEDYRLLADELVGLLDQVPAGIAGTDETGAA